MTLYVKDSFNTDTDTCKVNVSPAGGGNVAPVADAGPDKNAYVGKLVYFKGNGSYDLNGDPLQYKWYFGDGSPANWSGNSSTYHFYSSAGYYTVTLNVTDGALWDTDICYANITINNNNPPVADAGPDQNVTSFQNVFFNGSGSYDPDNDPLKYNWNFGDGDGTGWISVPYAYHTYANSTGFYTVTLLVKDSQYVDSDTCYVKVSTPGGGNNAPVASAGPDKYGKVGQTIYFDGNGSYDPDNDPLTYKWYFGDGSSTGWSSSYTASHSYSNTGNYTVKLSVNDGKLVDNDTCTVQIYSNTTPNNPPVSNAGSDKYAKVDQTVYFDGSLSFDPDNDPLTYKWYFGDGASTGWSSSNKASHAYSKTGNYTAKLSVYDGALYDNDTCIAHISAAGGGSNNTNSAPVAHAGWDQNGTVNQPVYLDGSGSYDPDNDPLTYKWVFGDGYQTGWQGNCNSSHVYNSTGNYTATIYVSDGKLTDSDDCVIYVTGGGWSPSPPAPPKDSDGDGHYDNVDAFPDDPTQWQDSDSDGRGDNIDGDDPDIFPADPNEWADTDGDGIGDNADAFPDDHTEWSDYDGDGVGDNTDMFPDDDLEWSDLDGD
ncbi:MAG: PKD domain-containing protein, partial [Thermoplasmata archaeon]|nr:PKD domain-containing protein [Thermoplasmata archaeon]